MKANHPNLRICHQRGMYGDCKDAAAFVGTCQIGDAHFDHVERKWLVSTFGPVVSHSVPVTTTRAAALELVDQIFQRAYEAKCMFDRRAA